MNRNISIREDEPLHEQLTADDIVLTEDGTAYRILNIKPHPTEAYTTTGIGEKLTIQHLTTGETQTYLYPDDDPLGVWSAQRVPRTVVHHPEDILREYVDHHISKDLSVLGRRHDHSIGGSVGIIEYAVKAALQEEFPVNHPPAREDDE